MLSDQLIIFIRYPEPGKAKTRLIPALGSEGAADLHRRMSEHTLGWVRNLQNRLPISVEVRYEGGNEDLFRQWLGPAFFYRSQGEGDLGERMARAMTEALQEGKERVILVGTDCPRLQGVQVQRALEELTRNDIVFGPANDGGYYLIGVRKVIPQLFIAIPWGTGEVLAKTLRIADKMQLRVFLLEPLDDVDRPEDLPVWEQEKN
jgi:rSAM/selenodomain-associated transferase 1